MNDENNYTRCLKCKHYREVERKLNVMGMETKEVHHECWVTGCADSIVPDNIKCPYYHKTAGGTFVSMKNSKYDKIKRPSHYNDHSSIECIDNMCLIFGATATHNYCLMNAYKYMSRYKFKNGLEDLQKARWYLDHAISLQHGYNLIVNNERFETLCSLCERYMIDYEEE